MMIYVDADARPVKDEIITVARPLPGDHGLHGGIRPNLHLLIGFITVDDGPDADIWIADKAGARDIVITNEVPLVANVANSADVLRLTEARSTLPISAAFWPHAT